MNILYSRNVPQKWFVSILDRTFNRNSHLMS